MADADTESNYFKNYPPPKALQKHEALARAFVELQVEKKRRVVLVTSGGTTVPVRTPSSLNISPCIYPI